MRRAGFTRVALVFTACALGACACASSAGNDGGATDGATDGAANGAAVAFYNGVYVVPPGEAAARYDVTEVRWLVVGDHVVLSYALPRLLVGGSVRVALVGTLSSDRTRATLAGPAGSATCETRPSDGAPLRCDERFVAPSVDLNGVAREAGRVDPGAVDARVAAAQRFLADPIGVLEVGAAMSAPAGARLCTADAGCDAGARCDLEGLAVGVCEGP